MTEASASGFRKHVAGALVAFGISLIMFQVLIGSNTFFSIKLTSIKDIFNAFLHIFLLIQILSSAIGGYVIGRIDGSRMIYSGVYTTLITYILESLYFFVFEGYIMGEIWVILCLFVGFNFGLFIANYFNTFGK